MTKLRTAFAIATCFACAAPEPGRSQQILPPPWDVVTRIDPQPGDGSPGPFGRISAVELGADGSVFVLDGLNHRISVFDSSGAFVRSFGSRGEGPGEMEYPIAMFWGSDGSLWLADARLGRFTLFTSEGTLVRTLRASVPPPLEPARFGFDASGNLLMVGLDLQGGSLENPGVALVEAAVEDGIVRTVGRTGLPFVQWPDVYRFEGSDIVLMMLIPFSPEPLFGFDRSGSLWYADSTDGTVGRRSGSGWDARVGGRTDPVPVVDEDVVQALEGNEDIDELRAVAGESEIRSFAERIPATKPLVTSYFFDEQGRIWLARSARAGATATPAEVFRTDGALLARGELRMAPRPHPVARGGWVAGVARDAFGRESVVVQRVAR